MTILEQNGSAMVSDLSAQLGVTEETIRRDLIKLESSEKICRVHGGAYLLRGGKRTVPVALRRRFFVEEKRRMAQCCLSMIKERECIMLDCSTTALVLAEALKEAQRSLTVITNSFEIVQTLGSCDFISLTCLGGTFRAESASFHGHITLTDLQNLYADKAFISSSSVHLDFGITDHLESEAHIRSMMFAHSQERILVADNTKFDSVAAYKLADLAELSAVVTDTPLDERWQEAFDRLAVPLIVAP